MEIIRREGVFRLRDETVSLILTSDEQLVRIMNDPYCDIVESGENQLYEPGVSLESLCAEGAKRGARRLEVSYDFFFAKDLGKKAFEDGGAREYYPDDEVTINAFKVFHDVAAKYGLGFSASVISPLDYGGGYAKRRGRAGQTCQFREGSVAPGGAFDVEIDWQVQWCNNKGPVRLTVERVLVYAFNEERIGDTAYYLVDPEGIANVSEAAKYETYPETVRIYEDLVERGYGHGRMRVYGVLPDGCAHYEKCLAVVVYNLPETDYFDPGAEGYVRGIIDAHKNAGIRYGGFYCDEMHIQFDWDLKNHFGKTEINTRYVTKSMADEYARLYGPEFKDFYKYLVYMAYDQHEGESGAQHTWGGEGRVEEAWLFRKRYFEMMKKKSVGLTLSIKKYAEELFGKPVMTRAHATWQESPTCDRFYETDFFQSERFGNKRYDYTPEYRWSSSIRENIATCYDYFLWNDVLSGGGSDHAEGGFADRNYYSQAFAASLGMLNEYGMAYAACWGSPKEVVRRFQNVGRCFGNTSHKAFPAHNLLQGMTQRLSDVLAIYPLDLNHAEERFGSWMVQYGYCDYITEDKLIENGRVTANGEIEVAGRAYGTLLTLFHPMPRPEFMEMAEELVKRGGKLVWTSVPATGGTRARFMELFGLSSVTPAYAGVKAGEITFTGELAHVGSMRVPTDMLPDLAYRIKTDGRGLIVARSDGAEAGVLRRTDNGGVAMYLGFRPRDDQSRSSGKDVRTLFDALSAVGAYTERTGEAISRPEASRFYIGRFANGTVTMAAHYRDFEERWPGGFFRDHAKDEELLKGRDVPPATVELDNVELWGRRISYSGSDVFSYKLGSCGKLDGFVMEKGRAVEIDGARYEICETPCDVSFVPIDARFLSDNIKSLHLAMCDVGQKIWLPYAGGPEGLLVRVCDNDVYSVGETAPPFEFNGGGVAIDVAGYENRVIALIKL